MKLSKKTLAILKNFSTINQSIVISQGNKLQTISNVKDVFGIAEVEETFENRFAIYDLNEFLGVISLFEDPDFVFDDKSVRVVENNNEQTYFFADESVITQPPEKGIHLPSVDVTFNLTREQLQSLVKAASINSATDLTFTNGNVKVHNKSVPNSNSFVVQNVGTSEVDYNLSISVDKLKMVADDYVVDVCAKGLAHFKGTQGIEYFVALQPGSTYGA